MLVGLDNYVEQLNWKTVSGEDMAMSVDIADVEREIENGM